MGVGVVGVGLWLWVMLHPDHPLCSAHSYWLWPPLLSSSSSSSSSPCSSPLPSPTPLFFPPGFVWGTATAAHQVEGRGPGREGRGREGGGKGEQKAFCNWDPFEAKGGNVLLNHTASVACDHWNRYEEDIELMKELGVNAYRFSVDWSKIEPEEGRFEEGAFAHYHRLIDHLRRRNIVPWLTLHHFTHPLWFARLGEFERRDNIKYFVRFARRVFAEYSGKVKHWCTINEPSVLASAGWFLGNFPPRKQDLNLTEIVLSNLLEAHVEVFHAIKGSILARAIQHYTASTISC